MAYPAETKALALKLYESGLSINKVSDELDIALATVHWWVRKAEIGRGSPINAYPEHIRNRAVSLRAEGWGVGDVSRELGIPIRTVRHWVRSVRPDVCRGSAGRYVRYTDEQRDMARNMLANGTSQEAIVRETGMSLTTVQRIGSGMRQTATNREVRLPVVVGKMPRLPQAACRDLSPTVFFDETGREDEAKAVCADCLVRVECLEWALRNHEPYGVWGGLNARERRRLARARRIDVRGAVNG